MDGSRDVEERQACSVRLSDSAIGAAGVGTPPPMSDPPPLEAAILAPRWLPSR